MPSYEVTLLPAQRKFMEVPETIEHSGMDVCIYQGGFGSGKTWVGALLGVTLALKYPGIIGLVGAFTFTLVRDTTLQMYFNHLDNLGIKYVYNKQEATLSLPNGSLIYFRHFDDPECFKSLSVGFIEIEEASQVPRQTFEDLHGRLRQTIKPEWGNFVYRFFGHTNPQGNKGWIYEYFKKSPRKNYRRVIAPTTENTYLPKDYVDSLKDIYTDEQFAMNVLGEDDNSVNNLIIKGFNPSVQIDESLRLKEEFPIHVTCDFNVDPMCWYISQVYNDNVYILYELIQENTTTDAAASYLCELLKKYKHRKIIINGDASGQMKTTKGVDYIFLKNRLYKEGFNYIETDLARKNPSIEWRLQCFNNMMYGKDKKHHIFIHPQCVRLIYNFENLELKPNSNKPKLPSAKQISSDSRLKYLGHPIDAVSYLVCYYFPIKDDTPWLEYNQANINTGIDIFGGKYDTRLI